MMSWQGCKDRMERDRRVLPELTSVVTWYGRTPAQYSLGVESNAVEISRIQVFSADRHNFTTNS
jgi:hypothetical protein